MGAMSPSHWIIVALVVLILFGSKKLPDTARGLGRALRIFKTEMKEMQGENTSAASSSPSTPDDHASSSAAFGSLSKAVASGDSEGSAGNSPISDITRKSHQA